MKFLDGECGALIRTYQVWQREKLLANKELQNSYRTLAKRALKSNNWIHRTVRAGSPLRRVVMYGLFQFVYTVLVTLPAAMMYPFYWPSLCYQVRKCLPDFRFLFEKS